MCLVLVFLMVVAAGVSCLLVVAWCCWVLLGKGVFLLAASTGLGEGHTPP